MIKKLNLTALLIMLMLINQLFAQTDKILLYGSCNIDEANKFDLENIKTTNFAKSYAKTLETWYEKFQIAWSDIEKMGFDAKFKRTWDMYLAYCRGGFLNGQLEVSQYLLKVK